MNCKICNNQTHQIFNAQILHKYTVTYFKCKNCGFIQTENPYWLDEAYKEPNNISDTGYLLRNVSLSHKLIILLALFFNRKGSFLDYAAGYGVFVRLMRDAGFNFFWDDKYTENIFAKGFDYDKNDTIEAVTTFESFEHFVNPLQEIEKILAISRNIIFSTELLPEDVPSPDKWWYYCFEHGQHISFYSKKTLKLIAARYALRVFSLGSLHIFTNKNNLSYIKLQIARLSEVGLHQIIKKLLLKSKTWDDYCKNSIL